MSPLCRCERTVRPSLRALRGLSAGFRHGRFCRVCIPAGVPPKGSCLRWRSLLRWRLTVRRPLLRIRCPLGIPTLCRIAFPPCWALPLPIAVPAPARMPYLLPQCRRLPPGVPPPVSLRPCRLPCGLPGHRTVPAAIPSRFCSPSVRDPGRKLPSLQTFDALQGLFRHVRRAD